MGLPAHLRRGRAAPSTTSHDTAECDVTTFDGREDFGYLGEDHDAISATECGVEGAAHNFMCFEDSPPDTRSTLTQTAMTPDQAWALRRHPLFYPVHEGRRPVTTEPAPGDTAPAEDDRRDSEPTDGIPPPEPARELVDYGSDPELDALANQCEGGGFSACDALFLRSPLDSSYEEYGKSCGGRNAPLEFCDDRYAPE